MRGKTPILVQFRTHPDSSDPPQPVRYVHIADPQRREAMRMYPLNDWLLVQEKTVSTQQTAAAVGLAANHPRDLRGKNPKVVEEFGPCHRR